MRAVSWPTNFAYCIAILVALEPAATALFVPMPRLGHGSSGNSLMPLLGIAPGALLGLYRLYLVAKGPHTLSSPRVGCVPDFVRALGVLFLWIGAVGGVLSLAAWPWIGAILPRRVEFVVGGFDLVHLAGVGWMGLFLFEFGRLAALEQSFRRST
jgi:hypothetical protein